MNLGQLLGNAGVVSQGWRQAEEAERVARQNQLAIEEQNRVADLKKQLAGLQIPSFQPVDVAQFMQPFVAGQAMPMEQTTPVWQPQPELVTPAPAASASPAASAAPAVSASPAASISTTPQAGLQYPPDSSDILRQLSQARMRLNQLKGPWYLPTPRQNKAGIEKTKQEIARLEEQVRTKIVPAARAEYQRVNPQYVPPEKPVAQKRATTPQSAKTASSKFAKTAQSYDNKTTPYDALIEQSAVQNGIDPVVFKRLLGTESSFNPKAVSPRGEKFGLGIAQISAAHGLTREQRLDPNTAIPFAAQLFGQYLRQAGGNYEEAIRRYKGASSEKGKTNISNAIGIILSGVTPSAEAASTPTPLEVPQTHARNMEMADFYLANPETIPVELEEVQKMAQQQAALITQQRNEAAKLAQVYMRSGTAQGIEAAMRLRDTINQADASLLQLQRQVAEKQTYLQGMQGLRELALANDPRRLAGVLTQYMGVPVGIQPRPDGKYNYYVNGRKVQDGVTPAQLASMALREFSAEARAANAASAALENELALKRKYGPEMVNAMRDIQKAIIDGEYKLAEERARQQAGKLTIDTSSGVAYFQRGNQVFVIQPNGKVEETPLGNIELPPTARQVVGLSMGQ